jgi:hypothetical protein
MKKADKKPCYDCAADARILHQAGEIMSNKDRATATHKYVKSMVDHTTKMSQSGAKVKGPSLGLAKKR